MALFDLSLDSLRSYKSQVIAPLDFDEFWTGTLADARTLATDPVFDKMDTGLELVDVFDVTFSGFAGHPIKAWFILPKQAEGSLPCVVKFIGYGGGRAFPHDHLLWPSAGYATLVMDTRGQGSTWSKGDTPDPVGSEPAHPGFMTRGISSRETYYYRRVFTDAVRAVETAMGHPSVDRARIAVTGGSQGGGIALAVSGLMPDIKACLPDVPFLCEFPRSVDITPRDPFPEISRYLAVHRDNAEQVFSTLAYFDGVNFARRAQANALFSVGLMDTVCPPSTVYAAYNAYQGSDKSIREYHYNDHEGGGSFQEREQLKWLGGIFKGKRLSQT